MPDFRNNPQRQLQFLSSQEEKLAHQKLSSHESERTDPISNVGSAVENPQEHFQPGANQRRWLKSEDVNSQQGSEDTRAAIARRKEPPVQSLKLQVQARAAQAKQLFPQQSSRQRSHVSGL